jgi:hypothetical protein
LYPADAGEPMPDVVVSTSQVQRCALPAVTRQVSLRNTGTNTLWISFDRKKWFDVACGTSWDDRVSIRELWHCTQTGRTRFAMIGVALLGGTASDDEDEDTDADDVRDRD